jgi:molybdopterin converting factor small subunit
MPFAMQINVKLFARAKELAGTGELVLNVPDGCDVRAAKAALVERYPELRTLMPILLIAVDGNYATDATRLSESCEFAGFPPVSGG